MDQVYFAGVPVLGDVRRLAEHFGQPAPGDEIAHEQVEAVLGIKRGKSRYGTVTGAWRRALLRDHNIDLAAVPSVGFRALTAEERIAVGIDGVQSGVRKLVRSVKRADRVLTDDPILQSKQDTMRRLGVAITQELTTTMRRIELPKPDTQQTRIVPMKQGARG